MSRRSTEVMVEPDRLDAVAVRAEAHSERLCSRGARVGEALAFVAHDQLPVDQIRRSADHIRAVASHAHDVSQRARDAGRGDRTPSFPLLPKWKWLRRVTRSVKRAARFVDDIPTLHWPSVVRNGVYEPLVRHYREHGPTVLWQDMLLAPFGPVWSIGMNEAAHHPAAFAQRAYYMAGGALFGTAALTRGMAGLIGGALIAGDQLHPGRIATRLGERSFEIALDDLRGVLVASGIMGTARDRHPRSENGTIVAAGLGSSSDSSDYLALFKLAHGVGANDERVQRFTYRQDGQDYRGDDTHQSIEESAAALDAQVRQYAHEHPGRHLDLIGHSEGGVVITYWMMKYYRPGRGGYPTVDHVTTVNSPLQGTPLASMDVHGNACPSIEAEIRRRAGGNGAGLPPDHKPSIEAMAEHSPVIRYINSQPIPNGVHFESIATSGDVAVPAQHAALKGHTAHVVDIVNGLDAHSDAVDAHQTIEEVRRMDQGLPEANRGLLGETRKIVSPRVINAVEQTGDTVLQAEGCNGR